MFGIELTGNASAIATMFVIAGMLTLFIRETYPPEVTAILGAVALLVLGILPTDEISSVLANPGPCVSLSGNQRGNAVCETGSRELDSARTSVLLDESLAHG